MAAKALPCPTLLRLLLDYDPETGKLYWKPRKPWMFRDGVQMDAATLCKRHNAKWAGKPAMATFSGSGYHGGINGVSVRAHRVAWAITYGKWPDQTIDHINGDPSDNKAENLRDISLRENMLNLGAHKGAASSYVGVDRCNGRWRARTLTPNGKEFFIGTFDTELDAAIARDAVNKLMRGKFARLNFPEAT